MPGMKCRKGNPGRDRWESRAQWMQRRGERLVRLLVGLCVCVCVCVHVCVCEAVTVHGAWSQAEERLEHYSEKTLDPLVMRSQ